MIEKQKIYKLSLLIIITRVLDGVTTYLASPDLKREQNPIIKYFDLGWSSVLLLGLLFVSLTVFLLVYGYKNQYVFKINSSNFKEYIFYFFFGKKIPFALAILSIPKLKPTIIFLGLVFPISLIYYSYFLIINNTFMFLTDVSDFFQQIYIQIYFIFQPLYIIMIFFVSILASYQVLYQQYRCRSLSKS